MKVKTFNIAKVMSWGCVDLLEVDPCGILRITGWSHEENTSTLPVPDVCLDNNRIAFLQVYRTPRPDVLFRSNDSVQPGFVFEYVLSDEFYPKAFCGVSIRFPDRSNLHFRDDLHFLRPHYANLLTTKEVLHREHIYGSGPPNMLLSPEVLTLVPLLSGRTLDFGCGSGAMVAHLRSQGLDARGLELNAPLIRSSIHSSVLPYVTLYDGQLPTLFTSKSFDCIYSSEVLEHIPNFEVAVTEMARLANHRLVLTTPDISAIPIGFRSGVVPWHLLEATHINFFTQTGLRRVLERYFSRIEFGRISHNRVNGSSYYVSLVAVCSF